MSVPARAFELKTLTQEQAPELVCESQNAYYGVLGSYGADHVVECTAISKIYVFPHSRKPLHAISVPTCLYLCSLTWLVFPGKASEGHA